MKLRRKSQFNISEQGSILMYEVVVIFVFSVALLGLLSVAVMQLKVLRSTVAREQAFQIAEAGVNYYQWRLAHFPTDYADGSGQTGCNPCGPYIRDYLDTNTNTVIGKYSLLITPPVTGSTIVTIESTGWFLENPNIRRKVTVRYGIPSLATYAFLTNSDVWIGGSETVNGELRANGGVRFDGSGNAPITSAKATYTCPSWSGSPPCPTVKNGVWGSANQQTQNFWQYPVPNYDFNNITSDLASIKSSAQSGGLYLPPSNVQGYSLVFNSDSTVSVYKVNSLRSHATGWDVNNVAHNENLDYNNRALQFTQALPGNGLIFVEDKTWVEGVVNGRALVTAAKLPYNVNTAPSILIPNNITYLAQDGSHALGLLAQKDILITYYAPATLNIHAAMIAQNGSAQRYYFPGNIKTSITLFGSLASFGAWTWSWVNGSGTVISGYQNTTTSYDTGLIYAPPPGFPLAGNGYTQISWSAN